MHASTDQNIHRYKCVIFPGAPLAVCRYGTMYMHTAKSNGNTMTSGSGVCWSWGCLGKSQARHHTADRISGRSSHNSIAAIFLPTNQAVSHTTTRCATPKTAPKRSQEMVCDRPNQLAITVGLSRKSESWVGTAGQRLRLVLATWYYASVDSAGMESLVYANVLNKNNSN